MKKLLFQFDTDPHPSVFDTVVAYDGGADHVTGFGGLTPDTISGLVEGAIFTRPPKDKKNTAIFIGGSDMIAGQDLLKAVQSKFFPGFQVSVMLDSNGCNTTSAAAVAKLAAGSPLAGKKAVVLAGTGPVGQRAAVMLSLEGAEVSLTGRKMDKAAAACRSMKARFGVDIVPVEAADTEARGRAIEKANIVFAAGAAGIELIGAEHWQDNPHIELIADANATQPIGIGGIDVFDKGVERHGKIVWGALGFGPLKLELHRACIAKLFTDNKLVFDAENIFELAKQMA
ncbi:MULTISPECIES: NADP-dependent methylenetetrahydromethanopterin/methylenetetrahydrofolate dehydrogenase [Methylomicrobium]|uniref:Putative ornithine cyclodeaminase, mu-crystallin n=1 Tax=Methylomicrobium album BG8 TaxID=686340 RepID=H8GPW2_METAL|nr:MULTISPECIES: NADP-dependent methylenetetrahydromethanopterin/methylenetetrahydrofolate dehydrogenase [Methylomicrobium]EIC29741.1 putative ornithine cyclodeaminase, mu-crystallin [Methylomicrobium album BG8]